MKIVVIKGEQFIHNEEKFYSFIKLIIEWGYKTLPELVELEIYKQLENTIFVDAIIKHNATLNSFNISMVWKPSLKKYFGHPKWDPKKKSEIAEIAWAEDAHFKWDEMGYYFDFDEKNKSINIYGSKDGLKEFCYKLYEFEDIYDYYPMFEYLDEQMYLGSYLTLILQYSKDRFISENYIYGDKDDFEFLARLISKKIKVSRPGDSFIIDKEYSDSNNQCLKFFVKDEFFEPSMMDEIVRKRPK